MPKRKIITEVFVWVMTALVALVCLRSGLMKLAVLPGVESWVRDFARWGYPDWFRVVVAIMELASFLLLLIPRLAALGATLFAVVMVGAIVTHATHGESSRLPFNLCLLVLCAVICYFRRPTFLRSGVTRVANTA